MEPDETRDATNAGWALAATLLGVFCGVMVALATAICLVDMARHKDETIAVFAAATVVGIAVALLVRRLILWQVHT